MNSLGIGKLCCSNKLWNVKIGQPAGSRSNTNCFIGEAHMKTIFICCSVYSYRLDAHLTACPDDTQGNFSSVGNEYFFKQNSLVMGDE